MQHRARPPIVWVLTDDRPGNTTQSIGLAGALGWPYDVKELHFNALIKPIHFLFGARWATRVGFDRGRSATLAHPWPDIVITAGWRAAPIARWIRKQSRGHTRLIQLARKGGQVAELFDVVITPTYACLPPHPRRIETIAPLTRVTPERLAQEAARWPHLFADAPRPHVALLVGGSTSRHRFDKETARRMGEEVRASVCTAGGSVFAITSRRTGAEATTALIQGLGATSHIHRWQPGQQDNPYLAYLALADVLVVTGESESMLAEAAAAGKPTYIYPLPEQSPSLKARIKDRMVTCAFRRPDDTHTQRRLSRAVNAFCGFAIAQGIIRPRRDLAALHRGLMQMGIARPFKAPLEIWSCPALQEAEKVARKVRKLLGFPEH